MLNLKSYLAAAGAFALAVLGGALAYLKIALSAARERAARAEQTVKAQNAHRQASRKAQKAQAEQRRENAEYERKFQESRGGERPAVFGDERLRDYDPDDTA